MARSLANFIPQCIMDPLHGTVQPPAAEVEPDHTPGRKIMRQHAPRAARASLVEDGVPDLAERVLPRAAGSTVLRWWQNRPDLLPLRLGEVGRITNACHARQPLQPARQLLHTLSWTGGSRQVRTVIWPVGHGSGTRLQRAPIPILTVLKGHLVRMPPARIGQLLLDLG